MKFYLPTCFRIKTFFNPENEIVSQIDWFQLFRDSEFRFKRNHSDVWIKIDSGQQKMILRQQKQKNDRINFIFKSLNDLVRLGLMAFEAILLNYDDDWIKNAWFWRLMTSETTMTPTSVVLLASLSTTWHVQCHKDFDMNWLRMEWKSLITALKQNLIQK